MTPRPSVSLAVVALLLLAVCDRPTSRVPATKLPASDLWQVYEQSLKGAKYVDLTHTLTPSIPVWKGFGPSTFNPAVDLQSGRTYNYAKDGFEAIPNSRAVLAVMRATSRSARPTGNTACR